MKYLKMIFFIDKGVFLIKNYARNPKNIVPMLYKYYVSRKLFVFLMIYQDKFFPPTAYVTK